MAQKMVKVKESSKKEIPPMSNFERYWNSQFLGMLYASCHF